jgi:hypothetical protein
VLATSDRSPFVTSSPIASKRQRAAALTATGAPIPTSGNLAVTWASPFDSLCYELAAPAMARKQPERYDGLVADLTSRTGCTEDEVLTHGQKVRSVLYFAEDRLGRQGVLARLSGNQQHPYRLAAVTLAF